ncbi:lytic transglycosylase domain-containing protein [Micromonospora sp. NPDC000316]|uniref:lytic transglycosylase domain-containing protein n=1 Tax=Micromonospora sp. NPDC000316 TaxID=3364216 RepID=UPI0036B2D60B
MSDTRRVADGEDKTRVQPLRPAAPLDGPLHGSGAAPDPAPRKLPRPRRPWLSGSRPDASVDPTSGAAPTEATASTTTGSPAADAPADAAKADPPDSESAAATSPTDPSAETSTADAKASDAEPGDAKASDGQAADTKAADAKDVAAKDVAAKDGAAKDGAADDGAGAAPAASTAGAAVADPTVTKADGVAVPPAPGGGRRRRVPFAHAGRRSLPPPRQAAATAVRATRDWSRRPSGRLTLPGLFLLALVAATAAAGALLVPATIRAPRPVAADASITPTAPMPPVMPSALPTGPLPTGLPTAPLPTGPLPTGPLPTGPLPGGGLPTGPGAGLPGSGGRPSDALAGWAQQVGAKVGIPPVAMQAYGYAEWVLSQTNRSCALSWTTLAAIGQVESGHGSANGARLGQDGRALPEIIGLPLDGNGGRMRIIDTDRGVLDKDTTYDRAIGPMQFIPTTWQEIGADADGDGVKNPHDLDDAALAAGNYLCKGGRNLSIPGDWWNAILSYNDVRRYAQAVYDTANRYGQASRT